MILSALQKFSEAKRELAMRRRVYPHFIERGKLKQEEADRQIAIMEAIVEDYRPAAEDESARPKPQLRQAKNNSQCSEQERL